MAPKLSVATGSVQFTSAVNRPRSAYTMSGLDGHVSPNVGGKMSAEKRKTLVQGKAEISVLR